MKKSIKFVLVIILSIIILCVIGIKFIPFGNKSYKNDKIMAPSLIIPKLSIFEEECCMFSASFKSFRSKSSLEKELDKIMKNYEKKTCNSKIYYYDKENDITITDYGFEQGFFMNKFYIVYDKGNYECDTTLDDLVENVTVQIYDISLTGATIIITDKNKEPYTYGQWYKIEKEENGKWIELPPKIKNYGFNDLGYLVDENNEVKFVMDWEWLYGKLDLGSYRIIKKVNDHYIYIPFGIATTS